MSNINHDFEKWALGFSGMDGGDIGAPSSQAIWVSGIEWGGGHSASSLLEEFNKNVSSPPDGYNDWAHNLKFKYNQQKMKLLSAVQGGIVADYKVFAETKRPFCVGSQGYFKTNLYPVGFRNVNHHHWLDSIAQVTGIETKQGYMDWCRIHRFPKLRSYAAKAKPQLIICAGVTFADDFKRAYAEVNSEFKLELIDGQALRWLRNDDDTLVVVIPFMTSPRGLKRNITIQAFGERIRELLLDER